MQEHNNQTNLAHHKSLPPIPNKIYFTIGEVSELCGLKQHVLRYLEQEFVVLRPAKRRGNRRYYQHSDVLLVRQIKDLLYNQGFTIEGARLQLSAQQENGNAGVSTAVVQEMIGELESVLCELEKA